MNRPQKIVVPTDFSDASWAALDWIRWQIQHDSAEIHCVTVIQQPLQPYFPTMAGAAIEYLPKLDDLIKMANESFVHAIATQQKKFEQPLLTKVLEGKPAEAIAAYADEIGAEMIVIAARGHNPLTTILLGDTAAGVVREAKCPVVTVKVPAANESTVSAMRDELRHLQEELGQSRAELGESVSAAKDEIREDWAALEEKWEEFNRHAADARHEAAVASEEVGKALSILGNELKRGYKRVRKAL